jgi:hypothetical protein
MKRTITLIGAANYRGEEYDPRTKSLKIQIGNIVFETVDILGRYTWLARTEGIGDLAKEQKMLRSPRGQFRGVLETRQRRKVHEEVY